MRVNESKLVSEISGSSGRLFTGVVDVTELDVLREEDAVALERPADGEARFKAADAGKRRGTAGSGCRA